MEKTKLGLSVAIMSALVFLVAAFGGYTPLLLVAGYILIAEENARVEEARRTAAAKIEELEEQLRSCLQALDRIKTANRPVTKAATNMYDFDSDNAEEETAEPDPIADVADEIAANLEAQIGTTADTAPTAKPMHPVSDTTGKFAGLGDRFGTNGPNFDPSHK